VHYRPLGHSGIEVSAIGFGAWGIGGRTAGATSYGETDDNVSRRALMESFDQGVTFYDTASVYGDGHSEELIGDCFSDCRDRVVIATKAGIRPSFEGYDFSASALRASLEASLRRLRTDYIDVFQLHNAGPGVVLNQPHIGELLSRFVQEGKVRIYGFSTLSPDDAVSLLDFPDTACFQVNCNLLDWRAIDGGLFDRAKSHGIGLIARTPLAFGFLTGRFEKDVVFPAQDHRSRWSREKIAAWVEATNAIFTELNIPIGEPSRVAVALRFCLSFEAVSSVIPGMFTRQEVLTNIAAIEAGPLDSGQLRCIEQVYRSHQARLDGKKE
jgi:aryl-alcohol dehydrogenase-like predicted oxidoreductase